MTGRHCCRSHRLRHCRRGIGCRDDSTRRRPRQSEQHPGTRHDRDSLEGRQRQHERWQQPSRRQSGDQHQQQGQLPAQHGPSLRRGTPARQLTLRPQQRRFSRLDRRQHPTFGPECPHLAQPGHRIQRRHAQARACAREAHTQSARTLRRDQRQHDRDRQHQRCQQQHRERTRRRHRPHQHRQQHHDRQGRDRDPNIQPIERLNVVNQPCQGVTRPQQTEPAERTLRHSSEEPDAQPRQRSERRPMRQHALDIPQHDSSRARQPQRPEQHQPAERGRHDRPPRRHRQSGPRPNAQQRDHGTRRQ